MTTDDLAAIRARYERLIYGSIYSYLDDGENVSDLGGIVAEDLQSLLSALDAAQAREQRLVEALQSIETKLDCALYDLVTMQGSVVETLLVDNSIQDIWGVIVSIREAGDIPPVKQW